MASGSEGPESRRPPRVIIERSSDGTPTRVAVSAYPAVGLWKVRWTLAIGHLLLLAAPLVAVRLFGLRQGLLMSLPFVVSAVWAVVRFPVAGVFGMLFASLDADVHTVRCASYFPYLPVLPRSRRLSWEEVERLDGRLLDVPRRAEALPALFVVAPRSQSYPLPPLTYAVAVALEELASSGGATEMFPAEVKEALRRDL